MKIILDWGICFFWIAAILFLQSIKRDSTRKILIKSNEIYWFCFLGIFIYYTSVFFATYLFY